MKEVFYVCEECNFIDSHGQGNEVEECPYCKNYSWVEFKPVGKITENKKLKVILTIEKIARILKGKSHLFTKDKSTSIFVELDEIIQNKNELISRLEYELNQIN